MKPKKILSFLLLVAALNSFSQAFQSGKLYLKVNQQIGIPDISISPVDTTIFMMDTTLQQIFQDHNVFSFVRTCPTIDEMNLINKYGLDIVYTLQCNCDEDSLMQEIIANANGIYDYIEKVPVDSMTYTPDDYHLQDPYPISGPDSALDLILAEEAWDFTHGDTSVIVGVIDGKIVVPWNHEDITGKVINWDTIGGAQVDFHGLFVSGSVAASTDNNLGKSSIGFNCRIAFSSHIGDPDALLRMSNMGIKVINASWGHPGNPNITMQNTINAITDNGTLLVAAAGNDNDTIYFYPASYANVLSVTSIGFNDHFVSWNPSAGVNGHHNHNDSVDICAPGYYVMGLWDACTSCYKRSTGSSFASPIVAGTAGLILSLNRCLSPGQLTDILKSTANDTIYEIPENQPYFGHIGSGRLDAGNAVRLTDSLYRVKNYIVEYGETITWSRDKYIDNYIRIDSGGTLTIQSNVFFNPGAQVEVKCGGTLIVDGGKLSTNCPCTLWDGILVWGNSARSQYTEGAQGYVSIKNGTIIENATTGIKLMGMGL